MDTLPFVIWMIGWPFAYEFAVSFARFCGKPYSKKALDNCTGFIVVIWIGIAILLWFNR